jgi:hypothetical protein
MVVNGRQWLSMVVNGCQWLLMVVDGSCPRLLMMAGLTKNIGHQPNRQSGMPCCDLASTATSICSDWPKLWM